MKSKEQSTKNLPSAWVSLIPFVFLSAILFVVIRIFGGNALDGASQVSLLLTTALVVAISILFYKISWEQLEEGILDNVRSVGSAILILFLIGAVAGSWMVSGIVPMMIYYGMNIITPKIFLFACCMICALISVMTGSSWTTIATIGVALIGIGTAQGYSAGWTAGAIISGAYFGDKISPLSDTTTLASSSTGTPLFTHIRYMMKTTIPSFVIAICVFLIVSLSGTFRITPWLMVTPLVTAFMISRKTPALLTLFIAALMAIATALIFQPQIIWQVATGRPVAEFTGLTFLEAFKGCMLSVYGPTSISMGNPQLEALIATNGITGMLPTVFLVISASAFGGVLVGSGMLISLTSMLQKGGDQYLSIILTGSLYKELYKDKGYENRLLSRSIEDSATVCSVLIPWNSCGMTQATILKVATAEYLPFCLFNLISPLMSILIAAIGWKIRRQHSF